MLGGSRRSRGVGDSMTKADMGAMRVAEFGQPPGLTVDGQNPA